MHNWLRGDRRGEITFCCWARPEVALYFLCYCGGIFGEGAEGGGDYFLLTGAPGGRALLSLLLMAGFLVRARRCKGLAEGFDYFLLTGAPGGRALLSLLLMAGLGCGLG